MATQLNPNLPLAGRAPQIEDPTRTVSGLIGLRDQFRKSQQEEKAVQNQEQLEDIYRRNTTVGPDGRLTVNRENVLGELVKTQPLAAVKQQNLWDLEDSEQAKMRRDLVKTQIDLETSIWQGATPENYGDRVRQLRAVGIVPENLPPGFDSKYIESRKARALKAKEAFKRQDEIAEKEAAAKSREEYAISREEFGSTFLADPAIQDIVGRLGQEAGPEAFVDLATAIAQSPHAGKKYALDFLDQVKPKGSSLVDKLGLLIAGQNIKSQQLTGEEKKQLGAVEGAVSDMNKLVTLYNVGDSSGFWPTVQGKLSGIPVLGQRLFPDEAEFNKHKRTIAERFLRAATGAAAPAQEVATYTGFLPNWGDTPEQAQAATDAFLNQVRSKSTAAVSRLRAEGFDDRASEIESNLKTMFDGIKKVNLSQKKVSKQKAKAPKKQQIFDYGSIDEANAANLPKGSLVRVGGKVYRVK